MEQINNPILMLQFSNLKGDRNIFHFQTTRHGGISTDTYSSLNLGEYCGDNPDSVEINRLRVCDSLQQRPSSLFVPNQVHESELLIIDEDFLSLPHEEQTDKLHGIDALATDIPGICIAVSTADCVPITLYAPDKKVTCVIHAGWRGTVLQIAIKTIDKIVRHFGCDPSFLIAGIGPSISMERFEVGDEVIASFRMIGSDMGKISKFNKYTGKYHMDLWEANRLQLIRAGIPSENIEVAGLCTYNHSEDFFSARRLGIQCGRMLSGIILTE